MTAIPNPVPRRAIHPFPAFLIAGAVTLFLGALLSDYAYWTSYQYAWSNGNDPARAQPEGSGAVVARNRRRCCQRSPLL